MSNKTTVFLLDNVDSFTYNLVDELRTLDLDIVVYRNTVSPELLLDKMVEKGVDAAYASKLIQYGWEVITEALKHGGITNMMDRLSNPAKVKAFELSEQLKQIMRPLYNKHMDDIISGEFSSGMMADWAEDDAKLLSWRAETAETAFEKQENTTEEISEQAFFDKGILMVAMVKAGVELAFDTMIEA